MRRLLWPLLGVLLCGCSPAVGQSPGPAGSSSSQPAGNEPPAAATVVLPTATPLPQVPGTIAFSKGHNLYIYSGGATTQLTTIGGVENPAWSPDGTQLAFDRAGKNSADLYVMDYPGGAPKALTANSSSIVENNFWEMQPAWSPDGRSLIYVSDRGRLRTGVLDPTLWRMAIATKARTQLSGSNAYTGGVDYPAWRPGFNSILYTSWDYEPDSLTPYGELDLLDVTHNTIGELTGYADSAMQPSWSPDGMHIATIRRVSGQDQVWMLTMPDAPSPSPAVRLGHFSLPSDAAAGARAADAAVGRTPADDGADVPGARSLPADATDDYGSADESVGPAPAADSPAAAGARSLSADVTAGYGATDTVGPTRAADSPAAAGVRSLSADSPDGPGARSDSAPSGGLMFAGNTAVASAASAATAVAPLAAVSAVAAGSAQPSSAPPTGAAPAGASSAASVAPAPAGSAPGAGPAGVGASLRASAVANGTSSASGVPSARASTSAQGTARAGASPVFVPTRAPIAIQPVQTPLPATTPEPSLFDTSGTLLVSGTNAHPVWSPSGDAIAYLGLVDGSFDLFVQQLGPDLQPAGKPRQLTSGAHLDADSSISWTA